MAVVPRIYMPSNRFATASTATAPASRARWREWKLVHLKATLLASALIPEIPFSFLPHFGSGSSLGPRGQSQ